MAENRNKHSQWGHAPSRLGEDTKFVLFATKLFCATVSLGSGGIRKNIDLLLTTSERVVYCNRVRQRSEDSN